MKKRKIFKVIIVGFALFAGLGAAYFGFTKYQSAQKEISDLKSKNSNSEAANKENSRMIQEVAKLIDVPPSENPTVATVADASKVKTQEFFAKAENGDKVLVYASIKKAILYRPSINKIIDVAPININSATTSAQPKVAGVATASANTKPTSTPIRTSLKILLLNGTSTAGLTSKIEPQIRQLYPQIEITKESANKTDYDKSQIISLSETGKAEVTKLASELNIAVSNESPYGEDLAGRADIALIIGKDKSQ